jgi:PadR family transcriptional regulator
MGKGDYLGEFEHLVLLALIRLDADAYGVSVRQELASRSGRDVSIGAVYATLDRLEQKGYVRSRIGESTAERGGRAKRHFTITARGTAAVERTHEVLRRMTEGLTSRLRAVRSDS